MWNDTPQKNRNYAWENCLNGNQVLFMVIGAPDVDTFVVTGDGPQSPSTMKSTAKTVDEYLNGLPSQRREAISAVRKVILANLPQGYQECMSYGMIGYVVPHSIYPKGYHGRSEIAVDICEPRFPKEPHGAISSRSAKSSKSHGRATKQ